MELNKLYDIADKEKIYIREKRLEDAKGMYANDTKYTEKSITNVEYYINDILKPAT